jgi:nicotinamidase-related amidase
MARTPDPLAADYDRAGFSGRLGFGVSPALVMIDMVQAYLLTDSPLYAGVEDALAGAATLLSAARAASVPVLHTRVAYQAGGLDGGVFYRKVPALRLFAEGADRRFAAFAPAVAPQAGEIVITKQYASAFFGTSLAATLASQRIDTLLIAGFSTSGCVRATALDACQHGFIPIVVRDAVGDRDAAVHAANLFDINAKYGDVIALEDALAHLAAKPSSDGQRHPR